jgi:hypothetical protein
LVFCADTRRASFVLTVDVLVLAFRSMRKLMTGAVVALALAMHMQAQAHAEEASLTIELAISSGKASVAADKRETRKLKVDTVIGGAVVHVEDRVATAIEIDTPQGADTSMVPIGLSLDVTTRATGGGGVLLYLSLDDHTALPLPYAGLGGTGVKARYGIRGLSVDTVVTMPARQDATLEVAAIEDAAADRAWLVTARVVAVHGNVETIAGKSPNSFLVDARDEGDGKGATVTTTRVTVAPDATGRVADEISLPVAKSGANGVGPHVEFVPYSVGMNASPSTTPQNWSVEVGTARVRGKDKDAQLEQRTASRQVTLVAGEAASDLGGFTDEAGKNLFHATIAIAKRE